jgi:dienelactone hydrolase
MVQVAAHRMDLPLPRMSSQPLMGYLARPDEPGRHPAVIELHGCGGFGTMDVVVADVLKSFGYVALALDSLGDANVCEQHPAGDGRLAEAFDAYATLDWLAEQNYVDSNRVALLGFSMGSADGASRMPPSRSHRPALA